MKKNREHKGDKKPVLTPFLKFVIAAAGVFAVFAVISFPVHTVNYTVYSDKVTKPFRVVHLSDLHAERYGKDMRNLIDLIDAQEPDLIALTGDIYDDKLDNSKTTTVLLGDLAKRYACVYVAGNHEFYNREQWIEQKAEAESLGVTVLEGEDISIGEITVCGSARRAEDTYDDWEEATKRCAAGADKDKFALLLVHFPHKIDEYRSYGCFDLILCGHTHGGHWRLPWSQNGVYGPDQGFFPKLSGGRFDYDDTTMIISRGLTRTKVKLPRILNNPEVVVVDILPEE
ncbi:MAG: metallophosphoesterase [Oscillospiraceae bacterium]|nr:metallophosphoesterase [Oscillospiraceae bacterium]